MDIIQTKTGHFRHPVHIIDGGLMEAQQIIVMDIVVLRDEMTT